MHNRGESGPPAKHGASVHCLGGALRDLPRTCHHTWPWEARTTPDQMQCHTNPSPAANGEPPHAGELPSGGCRNGAQHLRPLSLYPPSPAFPLLPHPGRMEKYDKIRVVGNGTFGKAWLIRSRITGRQFVMKAISTDGFDAQSDARREADVHARLVHPNIVRCVLRSKHTPAFVLSCLPARRPFL